MVESNHSAIRYLMVKRDDKPQLIRWILLLQEFDVEIIIRKGTENQMSDHLSCLKNAEFQCEKKDIEERFPDEQLFHVEIKEP